eukprot:353120-Chlamydomonas_euryale.AAC.9
MRACANSGCQVLIELCGGNNHSARNIAALREWRMHPSNCTGMNTCRFGSEPDFQREAPASPAVP